MSNTPKHILHTVQTSDKAVYFRDEMKHFDGKVILCGVIISASREIPPPFADPLPRAQEPSTGPQPQLADCSLRPNSPFPQHLSCYSYILHSHLISSTQPYRLMICTSQLFQVHYLATAEEQVSMLGQLMWDLWWTHWHWDSCLFSKYVGFSPVSIISPMLHARIPLTYHRPYVISRSDSGPHQNTLPLSMQTVRVPTISPSLV